ncbi:TPR-like protein [Aulographum hederae CBS 113979]|uniref:TPR-like protein n=1 Tax=Aulographum hederae CBS 113979 TaxID=1176131 RepID=A0A6G1H0T4_9PEZI|nr:TPR-like protein [Aulographum hederae CBS 113979]
MSNLSDADIAQLKGHLQHASIACAERCLYQSAKWAAEMLNSFESSDENSDTEVESPMSESNDTPLHSQPGILDINPHEARLDAKDLHKYLLAKTFFDCREFDRCAGVFLPHTLPKIPYTSSTAPSQDTPRTQPSSSKGKGKAAAPGKSASLTNTLLNTSQKALFLSLYAKYHAGEKRKDEESEMLLGPADTGITVNKELTGISATLDEWFALRRVDQDSAENGGGWLEYLYGIVLAKGKNEELAKEYLIRSVHLYPFNWGAWEELGDLIGTVEELAAVLPLLPKNMMTYMFHIYQSQELFQSTQDLENSIVRLQMIFPQSAFLATQRALIAYHAKDFDGASQTFAQILRAHPLRLNALDHYSNILFVLGNRPLLSFLAQLTTSIDAFRPETCIVAGNFLSLTSQHEKSVIYFRRALTLDRSFASAWTLMGHEYVEMKNTHAAIESYRRAVDSNRRDYRAWYGLGQTYEFLGMWQYSLFYYQRAAALRPYDGKMWSAVGACMARIGKLDNAIQAYKRALVAGSYYEGGGGGSFDSGESGGMAGLGGGVLDPETLFQIACLYERMYDKEECAAYMELVIAQEEGVSSTRDDELEGNASFRSSTASAPDAAGNGFSGVGVTATTSKARMWLARWSFSKGDYQRSAELANELCQDGVDVEDAKALVRDVRARMEADNA